MGVPPAKVHEKPNGSLWGGPPGPRPTPPSASAELAGSGSRGTRADQGYRPTKWFFDPVIRLVDRPLKAMVCPTIVGLVFASVMAGQTEWRPLFDGKSLAGWKESD